MIQSQLNKRNIYLEGYLQGCTNPFIPIEIVAAIGEDIWKQEMEKNAQSVKQNFIQSQQGDLEKSPFALIATTRSIQS